MRNESLTRARSLAKRRSLVRLYVSACLAGLPFHPALAQDDQAGTGQGDSAIQEVVVTGYRLSLENAAAAKRESVNFTDSVFAEDIGKFPDLNIAESLNRIPGIQLTREVNGEGLNIAIRGLGTNFTKVMLNGAQIAVASSGRTDAQNQNRELDLDLFPTELFTRLDVNKTPQASMLEGGVSGIVNMRSARPFDTPGYGLQMNYQFQGGYGEVSEKISPRGAITTSWKNDTFGVLVGLAAVRNKSQTEGFETIGWTNPDMNDAQCGEPSIDHDNNPATTPQNPCQYVTGGNNWTIPATVPEGAADALGLPVGTVIDKALLESLNPGVTARQIGDALIPRLARPAYLAGNRDRVAGLLSFEYRPSDRLQFYFDTMYADANREFDRLDMNLVGRAGQMIPVNMQVDENNVVTRATFVNAQYFLEARPYDEEVDFYNLNPGMHFDFNDWIGVDFQLNKSRSKFFREAPTVLVTTPINLVVEYENNGKPFPTITTNFDLNDPNAGWRWDNGGRVNIQNERRDTETEGAHLDVRFGDDRRNIKVGLAYDDISRRITAFDNTNAWQTLVCGGGVNTTCDGRAGSAVPLENLASYLRPGPAGFITVDFDRFFADTNYYELSANAPVASGSATNARSGYIGEETYGAYIEYNGVHDIDGKQLRVNAGVRYVQTDQTVASPFIINGEVQQGPWQTLKSDYDRVLPSFNLAYNMTDNFIVRAAASRTLTRANPSAMLPTTTFNDPSAFEANRGNPELQPFTSNNLDLGFEWYTGNEGFVALTLFQKEITGFTVQGRETIRFADLGFPFDSLTEQQRASINLRGGPDNALVEVIQQVNTNDDLRIRGYEVTWVQPLGRWVDALDGFGFNVNYTRVNQKSLGPSAPAVAVGVSPHTYNGTVYYEKGPASIRLSYVWNDDQIASDPGQNGIVGARLFTDASGQWDLSASYRLEWLPTSPLLTLNVINITGEEQRTTFMHDNATFTYYDPGYQILIGLRGNF